MGAPVDEPEEDKPVKVLDADDIRFLKSYGLGPYAKGIKSIEKDIIDIQKRVVEVCGIKESDTGLAPPSRWDLVSDKQMVYEDQPLQVRALCTHHATLCYCRRQSPSRWCTLTRPRRDALSLLSAFRGSTTCALALPSSASDHVHSNIHALRRPFRRAAWLVFGSACPRGRYPFEWARCALAMQKRSTDSPSKIV